MLINISCCTYINKSGQDAMRIAYMCVYLSSIILDVMIMRGDCKKKKVSICLFEKRQKGQNVILVFY